MDGAFASSLGQHRGSLAESFSGSSLVIAGNGSTHGLHGIAGTGASSTISAGLNKTLTMALESGLMVSHDYPPN